LPPSAVCGDRRGIGSAAEQNQRAVLGRGCLSAAENELRDLFAEGLAAYRARDWDRSEQRLAQCLAVVPTDGPAAVFRRRIEFLRDKTLTTDWDGVWHLTDK